MRGSVHILVPKMIEKMGFDAIDKVWSGFACVFDSLRVLCDPFTLSSMSSGHPP